ncbi:hypothetical protein PAF17_11125 [Paracoccus sp. Z330]|uniref:Uncharacterized protein n=1 Tax=Paracoccus onchidii TaxID=3017813 RepID=A0ABT4ZFN2_9RHOB|nr:hypothetical protein [Paracoccus onchidii]MDB6178054.1 hypothetical protein [Paracoccus onchidii]
MQLWLKADVTRWMRRHMLRAGSREISGMILEKQTGDQQFGDVDFTIDATSGSPSNFTLDAKQHDRALAEVFKKTGSDCHRFNYPGEWYAHPCCSLHQ